VSSVVCGVSSVVCGVECGVWCMDSELHIYWLTYRITY
jgi:hypothetical protein